MSISTAEMIEAVILCFLSGSRTTEGSLGGLVDIGGSQYRVTTATGITVIVRGPRGGRWAVAFKGFRGEDSELIVAASNALDGGTRRDASTIDDALRF